MNGIAAQSCHQIVEASQLGQMRRSAGELARQCKLDEAATSNLALVVTELATNLLKHAKRGVILLRALEHAAGVEVVAFDGGPGMSDVERCLGDGYSTGGTPGNGRGAVRRRADECDIWSGPGGSVAVARVLGAGRRGGHRIGSICLPVRGEHRCGDAWTVRYDDNAATLALVDGLGHGPVAADVADSAIAAFADAAAVDPAAAIGHIDARLRGTRGAAVAIASIAEDGTRLRYCAVGNIAGRLDGGGRWRGLVSGNGIIGGQYRRPQMFEYPVEAPGLLVLHSDGLRSHWDLGAYPGLRQRDPALIAAVLFRDFARGNDDVPVVVVGLRTDRQ